MVRRSKTGMNQKHMEKEWNLLLKSESRFLQKNRRQSEIKWQKKIESVVPEKLSLTLNGAFFKAFQMIFEKGTGIIEKTFDPEKKKQDYQINEYAAKIRGTRRSLRAFGKEASLSKTTNTAISAIGGVGMGVVGLGIPDIPVFLGLLLKSIYETAISFGFTYDTEEEQIFILKMIEVSLSHEDTLMKGNEMLNQWIEREEHFSITLKEQMKRTSESLSRELLYLKFIQGIPIVGVAGGISDMIYQKKITDFVTIKYKRRFLTNIGIEN